MKKLVVFGSLNMDLSIESDHMPTLGETIVGKGFITNPGGKGANQSVAAAKLGAQVYHVGSVGVDAFGEQMLSAMEDAGVNCEFVARSEKAPTGVALITRVGGDNFITIDSGANFVTNSSDVCTALDSLAAPGDVFLAQLECDFETTWASLIEAHKRGMYVALNPAPAHEIPDEVLTCLDMVAVNEIECETISGIYPGDASSAQKAADALMEKGVGCVVITLGARGSLVFKGKDMVESIPPKVNAIDTTCAGDTYIGALLSAYVRGLSLEEGVEFATKASALATTTVGAQQSIPTLEMVQ